MDRLYWHLDTQVFSDGESQPFAPTRTDVQDAVAFLASRAVNILGEVPGSDGAYQLVMTPSTARKRLLALARYIDGDNLATEAILAGGRSPLVGR